MEQGDPMEWFDKEMAAIDEQLGRGEITYKEHRRQSAARSYRPLRIEQIRDLLRLAAQVAVAAEYEGSMAHDELQALHAAVDEAEHWADIRE